MSNIPFAVMQPGKLVADITMEIISGPQKSLEAVLQAKAYLNHVRSNPCELLSESVLDGVVDRFGLAVRLYHLAAMRFEVSTVALARVCTFIEYSFEDVNAFALRHIYDMPLDEIARVLKRDANTVDSGICAFQRNIQMAVRKLLVSRVDNTADGVSATWLDAQNALQEDFREIQSLVDNVRSIYDKYEQWREDLCSWDDGEPCDAELRLECWATGEDCEECALNRCEAYRQASRLLRDYNRILTARMDDAERVMRSLLKLPDIGAMILSDTENISYDSLVADVDRYINTPEMSAENLREEYKRAIVEDNQIPIDGETAEAYTNICFVLECGRPHGYDPNLDWALRVMSSTLDQPALQVKALVTAIEQAKAANPASVALVS